MLALLMLLFITVPLIELAVLIKVGQYLGVFNTLAIVIGTGLLGAILAKSQGLKVLQGIQYKLNMGIIPSDELIDGLFILCGGIMLLTPGLITDALGFLCLLPYSRKPLKAWLKGKFKKMIDGGSVIGCGSFRF